MVLGGQIPQLVEVKEVDDRVVFINRHVDDDVVGSRIVEGIDNVEAEEWGCLQMGNEKSVGTAITEKHAPCTLPRGHRPSDQRHKTVCRA